MSRKVLISINAAWNIANFRAGLVNALREAGYQVVAVAPPDQHVPRIMALGVRFVPFPMDSNGVNPFKDFMLFLRYLAMFWREKPSIYLSFTVKPNIFGGLAAACLGIPAISNVAGLGTPFVRDTWVTRVVEFLYRVAFWKARKVFFQNDEDMVLFDERRLINRQVADRLPGSGVDTEHFAPHTGEATRRLGPIRFLLLARLLWAKGIGEYVEAARQLRADGVAAEFQLLGFVNSASPTAISREQVEQWQCEGIITYLGEMEDVKPALTDADCVVLPSYYREGVPRSLLEAASMGKPVITTETVGCRDAVDDGVTGLLCRPRDSEDLAEKMREFANMPPIERQDFGRRGREKMIREFDERIVTKRYLETIEDILHIDRPTNSLSSD